MIVVSSVWVTISSAKLTQFIFHKQFCYFYSVNSLSSSFLHLKYYLSFKYFILLQFCQIMIIDTNEVGWTGFSLSLSFSVTLQSHPDPGLSYFCFESPHHHATVFQPRTLVICQYLVFYLHLFYSVFIYT